MVLFSPLNILQNILILMMRDSEHMNLNEKKQQLELPLLEDQLHTE